MPEPSRQARSGLVAGLLFAGVLAVYLATPPHTSSGDTHASVLTAISLLQGHGGRIDTVTLPAPPNPDPRRVYLIESGRGGWVSPYGIGVPLALLPVYALGRLAGVDDATLAADACNRAIAAAWTALALALVWGTLRRAGDGFAAGFATAGLACGSSALSLLSHEVWQHSLLLLLSAALLALLWPRPRALPPGLAAAAGLLAGWGVAARPTALLYAPVWAWVVWREHRPRLAVFAAGLAPALLGVAAYNWATFGSPLAAGQLLLGEARFAGAGGPFVPRALAALAGLLVSPGRGLLVYSPVLLVALFALRQRSTDRPSQDPLRRLAVPALAAIALNLLAAAAWREWWGGFTYGPRYLSETLVFWAALLAGGMSSLRSLPAARRRLAVAAAGVLLVVSIAFHAGGLLVDPYSPRSHNATLNPDAHPEVLWRWSDFPPLYNLRVAMRSRQPVPRP